MELNVIMLKIIFLFLQFNIKIFKNLDLHIHLNKIYFHLFIL